MIAVEPDMTHRLFIDPILRIAVRNHDVIRGYALLTNALDAPSEAASPPCSTE